MDTTTTTETTAPTAYRIPAHRLSIFTTRFEALQRRAVKLGCEAPQAHVGELAVQKVTERDPFDGETYVTYLEYYPVTVTGTAPSYSGWTFLAVVDYEAAAPTFRKTPAADAFEVPVRYRETGPICEHCQVDRRRTETFILRHEDGRVVQVGRQCIRDFLGHHTPEHIAALAAFEAQVRDCLGCEADEMALGVGPFVPEVESFLSWVVWSINRWGWVSRKASSDFGRRATASCAEEAFEKYLKACREGRGDRAAKPGDLEKARAAEVLGWARQIGDGETRTLSDYEHNLKTICSLGRVGSKHFGLVASAVPAFDREVARRKAVKSEHVGEVGERLRGVRVFVDRVIGLADSAYGTSIVVMRDLEGHAFKWFTTRVPDTGREYEMTATVKEHGEWQGTLQTIVTRAELHADDEPTKAERRQASALDSVLASAAQSLCWKPIEWQGWKAFTARRTEAAEACNLVELEALRAELYGVAGVVEPHHEPDGDEQRQRGVLLRALVCARLVAHDPKRAAPKLKAAAKEEIRQVAASIHAAQEALCSWPMNDLLAHLFADVADAYATLGDLAALRALRDELRARALVVAPEYGDETAEKEAAIAHTRDTCARVLGAVAVVPAESNSRSRARATKAAPAVETAPASA